MDDRKFAMQKEDRASEVTPNLDDIGRQQFFSIGELADRWRCSRGTVYNRLRNAGVKLLDFAAPGKRGRKVIATLVVLRIETQNTKRLW